MTDISTQKATLCFLTKGTPPTHILLGYKKSGFGKGKYFGIGGKVEQGESYQEAALREVKEEIGVEILHININFAAHLIFSFPYKPEWNQEVMVYLVNSWKGEPLESAEMKPEWFKIKDIPYQQMWSDNAHWLPIILNHRRVKAEFTFGEDNEDITEMIIEDM